MAHVGTTLELQQQPAATGSSRATGLWLALITAAVVVAIGFAIVMAQLASVSGSLGADRGYDQIEAIRGGATLTVDRGYDQIEALRGDALGGAPAAGPKFQQFKHAPGKGPLP